jgi:hypothetical protein
MIPTITAAPPQNPIKRGKSEPFPRGGLSDIRDGIMFLSRGQVDPGVDPAARKKHAEVAE